MGHLERAERLRRVEKAVKWNQRGGRLNRPRPTQPKRRKDSKPEPSDVAPDVAE